MSQDLYSRNHLFIKPEQQAQLGQARLLLAGAGIGSVIAETALRVGFRRFRLVDHDQVETSNLNRQNYTALDVGSHKVHCLERRLHAIDPTVEVEALPLRMDASNIPDLLSDVDVVVNCLDFDTDAPYGLDTQAFERNIPVLHPFNWGWAGACAVMTRSSPTMADCFGQDDSLAMRLLEHASAQEEAAGRDDLKWLTELLRQIIETKLTFYPQLRLGTDLCSALACRILIALLLGEEVQTFPYIHVTSIHQLS